MTVCLAVNPVPEANNSVRKPQFPAGQRLEYPLVGDVDPIVVVFASVEGTDRGAVLFAPAYEPASALNASALSSSVDPGDECVPSTVLREEAMSKNSAWLAAGDRGGDLLDSLTAFQTPWL